MVTLTKASPYPIDVTTSWQLGENCWEVGALKMMSLMPAFPSRPALANEPDPIAYLGQIPVQISTNHETL